MTTFLRETLANWRKWPWLALVIGSYGIFWRILTFVARGSLWLDEIKLAFSIGTKGFVDLLKPLDFEQVAAPLFLWAAKIVTLLFGMDERALRTLSFVAGLALVPAMFGTTSRILGRLEATMGVAIVALSPMFFRYAIEFKPYGLDALLSVLVLLGCSRAVSTRKIGWVAGVVMIATFASTPAPFYVAPSLLWLWRQYRRAGAVAEANRVAVIATLSMGAFAVLYVSVYRHASSMPMMQRYWEANFVAPPATLKNGGIVATELIENLYGLFGQSLDPQIKWGAWICILIGAGILWARDRELSVLLLSPFLLAVFASSLRRFALSPRLLLFAAPQLVMVATVALGGLAKWVYERDPEKIAHVLTVIGILPVIHRPVGSFHFAADRGAREIIHETEQRLFDGDTVYVAARSAPAWVYYTTDWKHPDVDRLAWFAKAGAATGPIYENAGSRRWVTPEDVETLDRRYRGRNEMFGLPSGQEYRASTYVSQRLPDPFVLPFELRRIERVRGPLWVVAVDAVDGFGARLVDALEQGGSTVRRRYAQHEVSVIEVQLKQGRHENVSIGRPETEPDDLSSDSKSSDAKPVTEERR